jgi:hypothetical protein
MAAAAAIAPRNASCRARLANVGSMLACDIVPAAPAGSSRGRTFTTMEPLSLIFENPLNAFAEARFSCGETLLF